MVPRGVRQYIEPMPSLSWPRPFDAIRARLPDVARFSLPVLPRQCLLCGSWQSLPCCTACLTTWRPARQRCLRCAIDLPQRRANDICMRCEDQSPEFDRAIAALDYTPPWTSLMADLKFREATALAKPLAALLAEAVAQRPHRVDLVLPVPLSPVRLRERGYNQAWLIAREVARRRGLLARPDVLQRTRDTTRLMSLSTEERQAQIQGAFEVTGALAGQPLRGRHIALVDDVMTTGATLQALSLLLRAHGARSVSAWVVARTPAPSRHDRNLLEFPPKGR